MLLDVNAGMTILSAIYRQLSLNQSLRRIYIFVHSQMFDIVPQDLIASILRFGYVAQLA